MACCCSTPTPVTAPARLLCSATGSTVGLKIGWRSRGQRAYFRIARIRQSGRTLTRVVRSSRDSSCARSCCVAYERSSRPSRGARRYRIDRQRKPRTRHVRVAGSGSAALQTTTELIGSPSLVSHWESTRSGAGGIVEAFGIVAAIAVDVDDCADSAGVHQFDETPQVTAGNRRDSRTGSRCGANVGSDWRSVCRDGRRHDLLQHVKEA